MRRYYTVVLTKKPIINTWKEGYFPRNFIYQADAVRLVEEVRSKGGDAKIEDQRGPG